MGKGTNIFLASLLGISIFVGVCNEKRNKNKVNKQEIKISELETKIENDSIANSKIYLKLSSLLKDTSIFYSDSLGKVLNLYNLTLSKNEKFNEIIKKLSYASKKTENLENKKFQEKYKNLENNYNFLTNDYDTLKTNNINLREKYANLEKKFNKKLVEQEINSPSTNKKEISFNVKNQSLFRNWKSIPPKLFSVGKESISFKDNNPQNMEAFAKYESGRLIPLKKLEESDKCSSFYLPPIDFDKGSLVVYAIDKDGNQSKKHFIYISDNTISKKKIE